MHPKSNEHRVYQAAVPKYIRYTVESTGKVLDGSLIGTSGSMKQGGCQEVASANFWFLTFVGAFAKSEGRCTQVSRTVAALASADKCGSEVSVHLRAADPEGASAAAGKLHARSADPEGASAAAGELLSLRW